MAEAALEHLGQASIDDPLRHFEVQTTTSTGAPVNTLNIKVDDELTVRLRGIYEGVRDVARVQLHRYDYPNSAPHATQAWQGYRDLLGFSFAATPANGVLWPTLFGNCSLRCRRRPLGLGPTPFPVLSRSSLLTSRTLRRVSLLGLSCKE